jgi:hypothetical protein
MPNTANGLPYPAPSSAPNIPADIQSLANGIETGFGGTTTTYAPTLGWTNTTATVAKYTRVGQLVFVEFVLTLTGTPVGTFSISLPSTATATANRQACGTAMLNDGPSDTTRRSATCFLLSTTTMSLLVDSATSSALVSTTVPWTWASGDILGGQFFYTEA